MWKFRFYLKSFLFKKPRKVTPSKKPVKIKVDRDKTNPLISPSTNNWSSQGTFNPATIQDEFGKVYMLYRALGDDGISRFGYATCQNGALFPTQLGYPVFTFDYQKANLKNSKISKKFDRDLYPSGGGWAGAEDPRIVSIDGKIYVTFNTFDGWDFIRVTVVSIDENDFFKQKFKWSKPKFISPPNEIHKNWVIFPEKIRGKFAILHSLTPNIQIDYVDNLEDLANQKVTIKSKHSQPKDNDTWDTWMRGVGPPPIKTERGWLVLYHAVNKDFPHQYRLGALLLDLKNPKKLIAKSPSFLLMPETWYENDWKLGVIYACGTTVKNGNLQIYYGAGDKHICLAETPLNALLDWIISNKKTIKI